jgi:hypothetical protein
MTTSPSNFAGLMDTRVALGKGGRDGHPCAYCWPALVHATRKDGTGRYCCTCCAERLHLQLFDAPPPALPRAA